MTPKFEVLWGPEGLRLLGHSLRLSCPQRHGLHSNLVQPGFLVSFIHSFSEGHVPDSELGTDDRKRTWLSVWGEGCIAFSLSGQKGLEKLHVN